MADEGGGHGRPNVSIAIEALPMAAATLRDDRVIVANRRWIDAVGTEATGPKVLALLEAARTGRQVELGVTAHLVVGVGDQPDLLLLLPDLAEAPVAGGSLLGPAEAHAFLGHGVIIGDGSRILHVSDGAAELFGRSPTALVETGTLFELFEPAEQQRLTDQIAHHRATGLPVPEHFETSVLRPDGTVVPVEIWVKAKVVDQVIRTYTLIADARESRSRHEHLVHRALHDELTGLPNRYLLMDRIEMVSEQLVRRDGTAALHFLDLDGFKEVNDQYGHIAGDQVLRTIGRRLDATVRSCDTVARLGGDEFAVLCSDLDDHRDAEALSARLRSACAEPVTGSGWSASVGMSIGTVSFSDASLDGETLLAHADLAMYEQKRERAAEV